MFYLNAGDDTDDDTIHVNACCVSQRYSSREIDDFDIVL